MAVVIVAQACATGRERSAETKAPPPATPATEERAAQPTVPDSFRRLSAEVASLGSGPIEVHVRQVGSLLLSRPEIFLINA